MKSTPHLSFLLRLLLCGLAAGGARAAELELISRGAYPAGASQPGKMAVGDRRAFSADGRLFVFSSSATAVVPGLLDLNGQSDVFVKDRLSGATRLVSFAAGLPQWTGNGASFDPRLSPDGRYVVFLSRAQNLTATPTSEAQVFRHDLQTGATRLISHLAGQPTAPLPTPVLGIGDLSPDGRFVALYTSAPSSLLVPGTTDVNTFEDLFLWNESGDTFQLVSHKVDLPLETAGLDGLYRNVRVAAGGLAAFVGPRRLAIAANGGVRQAYIFDPATGNNVLASPSTTPGAASNGDSSDVCALTPDGRYLLYTSFALDLVAGQADGNFANGPDLFLYDRAAATVELVSEKSGQPGRTGNGPTACGAISDDGRFVLLRTEATDLVAGVTDVGGTWDLIRQDRQNGSRVFITAAAADPATATGCAFVSPAATFLDPKYLALTADGGKAIFNCFGTAIYAFPLIGVGLGDPWSFRWDEGLAAIELAIGLPGNSATAPPSRPLAMSADGAAALYDTDFPGELTGAPHLARDTPQFLLGEDGRGPVELVAPAAFAGRGSGSVATAAFYSAFAGPPPRAFASEDGSKVAFLTASREICGDAVADPLCLLERASGAMTQVPAAAGEKIHPLGFTADGRHLLVESLGALAAGDGNADWDLYLYDTVAASFEIVSRAAGSSAATGNRASRSLRDGMSGLLTPDGRRLVFDSRADNLVAGSTVSSSYENVYLADRVAGTTLLVSHRPGEPLAGGNGASTNARISADGRYVLYLSHATDLVAGMVDGQGTDSGDLYLYDVAAGTTALVSRFPDNTHISTGSQNLAFLSGDGRYVLHQSGYSLMLGMSDPDHSGGTYRYDRATATNTLVSHAAGDPLRSADEPCVPEGLSQNGRFALLSCAATNLAPGVSGRQAYLWDGQDGSIRLASHREGAPATGVGLINEGYPARLAPDGSRVFFATADANVIPGLADQPGSADVFAWERATGDVELLTPLFGASDTAGGSGCRFESGLAPPAAGGEHVLFYCASPSLALYDNNLAADLFLATLSRTLFADGFESGSTAAWDRP